MTQPSLALGPVPDHWASAPLRHCVELRNDRTRHESDLGPLIGLEHVESWTGRLLSRPEDVETEGQHSLFRRGDVLFGKLRPYLAKAHRAQQDGACSAELLVLRPRAIDAGFLLYCLLSAPWVSLIDSSTFGSKMPRANWEFIGHQILPVPSMPEQRAIADFLDSETERIDALVAKKQRLIELLQEKRTALISHAVTKGLDPDAPMKDSGIEWFGRIPEHWPVVRLGHFARVHNGSTPSREDTAYWLDGTVPWLASTKVNEDRVTSPSELISETALRECSLTLMPAGSVIIGLVGQGRTRGMAALLGIEATINQNMAAIIPRRRIMGRYLQYQLESMYIPIRESGRGANQAALNCELVADLHLPSPPPAEQVAIARFLDERTEAIRALVDKTRRSIDLLGESRSALITAAVTGQIDVGAQ